MSVRLLRETFEPELLTPDSRLQEGDGAVVEVHTLFHDMDRYMSQTKMPNCFIATNDVILEYQEAQRQLCTWWAFPG